MYLIDLNYRIIRKSPLYTRKNNNINPALFGAMAVTLHEVLRVQQAEGKKIPYKWWNCEAQKYSCYSQSIFLLLFASQSRSAAWQIVFFRTICNDIIPVNFS